MPKSRAKTPAQMKRHNQIQKAYVGNNNRVRPKTAKMPSNNFARGTRRSQKSTSQDKKIDQTIERIGEAIHKLNGQLSEFVTKKYLNTRLAELEQKTLNRFGESEAQHLRAQLKPSQRQSLQRQASEDSGFSFNTADLFQTPPQPQNKKSSPKK